MFRLTKREWSPYEAGVIIGLLQIPAFYLVDTALGASSSFVTAAGYLASLVDAGVSENAYFTKYMTKTKYFWQSGLVIGIVLGAYVSARASGTLRSGFSGAWRQLTAIKSLSGRMAMGFVGGFVLLLGARIAGGCTSGHGISGLSQLAVGSIMATTAMFVGGMVLAAALPKLK